MAVVLKETTACHQCLIVAAFFDCLRNELLDRFTHRRGSDLSQRVPTGLRHHLMKIEVGLAERALALPPCRTHEGYRLFVPNEICIAMSHSLTGRRAAHPELGDQLALAGQPITNLQITGKYSRFDEAHDFSKARALAGLRAGCDILTAY